VKRTLLRLPFPPEIAGHYADLARESIAEQQRREAADHVPFEIFRQQYLDIHGLSV
jgi:hypothetical protein